MAEKSNHAMTKYNAEALDAETVEETLSLEQASNFNQAINRNKEILDKGLKASEDELKQLANIQNNINLANQKKQELIRMHYQNYISDITYQNHIIISHNNSIHYAMQRGIQFWKSYDGSGIFYRINAFTKKKKLNVEKDSYSLLGTHIKIYDSIGEVQFSNENTLILMASYLPIVKDEIFDSYEATEWVTHNNFTYKNIFKYTTFLEKRLWRPYQQRYPNQRVPVAQQQIKLLNPISSISNIDTSRLIRVDHLTEYELKKLRQQPEIKDSIIQDFISNLSQNKYQYDYIMNWLANFFQTLHQSSMALVLIGDSKTTGMLINKIIKPIFAYKKEYFSVINEETLKKANDTIIKDKIFYNIDTDNLSKDDIKSPQLSNLLLELIKPNSLDFIQAIENNEIYIHGETIVTSSDESPYPFLKNSYDRCSVFSVANIETILKKMDLGLSEIGKLITVDLDNFSNILAQYRTDNYYHTIAVTDEKNVLSKMKKGVLTTPNLEEKIQLFVGAVKRKDVWYFKKLEQEDDKNLYKELVENFDNDDAIYQPLLSEYFNIVNGDIIFSDNSYFIEILKERECLFNQAADDKFKRNGQRRYKIYNYKLAKNYQGNCQDIL